MLLSARNNHSTLNAKAAEGTAALLHDAGARFAHANRALHLPRPRPMLCSCHEMNEGSEAIARWLEQKRRANRASAAVISVLALGSGAVVFLLAALLIYTLLTLVCGGFSYSVPWPGLIALGLTAGI